MADGRRAASLRGLQTYVVNQKQRVSALGLQRALGLGSYQTAANQLTNGVRVPAKMVPAVTDVSGR